MIKKRLIVHFATILSLLAASSFLVYILTLHETRSALYARLFASELVRRLLEVSQAGGVEYHTHDADGPIRLFPTEEVEFVSEKGNKQIALVALSTVDEATCIFESRSDQRSEISGDKCPLNITIATKTLDDNRYEHHVTILFIR